MWQQEVTVRLVCPDQPQFMPVVPTWKIQYIFFSLLLYIRFPMLTDFRGGMDFLSKASKPPSSQTWKIVGQISLPR